MNNDRQNNVCLRYIDVLIIVFVVLKLANVIRWEWIWVLSPLWGEILIVIIYNLVIFIRSVKAINQITKRRKDDPHDNH